MSLKTDAQKAKACRSVEIEDEHGAAIIIKETPDRDRLMIYTRAGKKGGDHRVFLTNEQVQHLCSVSRYSLDVNEEKRPDGKIPPPVDEPEPVDAEFPDPGMEANEEAVL